jgi:K+-dependent Na+/Ca+ exchanger-like protein
MGLFYMFVAIAIVCDECFVPTLEVITEVLGLSPDVAGATFMAAGGSAPEFFTSLIGAMVVESDIGTGTIIGSAVFNVLFVIGACALVAPEPLHLTWFPLARDSSFYAVDLLVVTAVFLDEKVKWWEALILFLLYLGYACFMKYSQDVEDWALSRGEPKEEAEVVDDDTTWAKKRDQSQNSPPPIPATPDKVGVSAGTGEGGDDLVLRRSSSSAPHEKKHFRHKSIREAHHVFPGSKESCHSQQQPPLGSSENLAGSTGGSADPPVPPCPAPKLADWQLTDVVPNMEVGRSSSSDGDASAIDAADCEAADDEENKPLSISPPKDNNLKDWAWYVLTFPIVFCLVFTVPDVRREGYKKYVVFSFTLAIMWIAGFTWVMVWMATAIAETANLDETIMGLTILAAGTSVPDLLTSMIVARQGHGDMAISSSIGSNIFDVTVGLPVPWMVFHIVRGKDVTIKNEGLEITVMLLLGMLGFTIGTILVHNWVMTKWMGSSLMFLYLLFEVVAVGLTFAPEGSLKIIQV